MAVEKLGHLHMTAMTLFPEPFCTRLTTSSIPVGARDTILWPLHVLELGNSDTIAGPVGLTDILDWQCDRISLAPRPKGQY